MKERFDAIQAAMLSMKRGSRLDAAQKAALGFLDVLQPNDRAMVVSFSDKPRIPDGVSPQAKSMADKRRCHGSIAELLAAGCPWPSAQHDDVNVYT